jgi:pre-mRNA-splicing factor SYF1
MNLKK